MKLLYGLMLDRMSLSKKGGWLDEDNKVFIKYSLNTIEEDLNVSCKTAGNILKELEGIGLIEMVQQNGIANIIYVKNFISENRESTVKSRTSRDECKTSTSEEMLPVEKMLQCNNDTSEEFTPVEKVHQCNDYTSEDSAPVQNLHQRKFDAATSVESEPVPGEILHPNNIESNNKMIKNNFINQSYQQMDPMDEASAYMEIIRENIEYDCMMSDKNWQDAEMYDEFYQIICDVVCVPRKKIRIAGEEYPYSLVKSKFLKLNIVIYSMLSAVCRTIQLRLLISKRI